ncbi:MAG TPA: O-antigen ligase family protein, partial [Ktedonobacterales bacterium]|nr:O-antigen ligase family protein [Ktedonobacterales bacterium]
MQLFIRLEWLSRLPIRFVEPGLCLTFILFFFWHHPPASFVLLLIAAGLAWIRLEIAIALLPLTFPYYLDLQPFNSNGSLAFSLNELGVLLCVGVALLRNILLPQERRATWEWLQGLWRSARLLLLPAFLFLIGASLAVLVSPNWHLSLRAYREEIIEPILYFLLISRYLRTRNDLARTIGALVLSAIIAACMGIIQGVFHITSDLAMVNAATFRVNGPYGNPNNLAFLLDRALPILLALALLGVWRRPDAEASLQQSSWRDPLRWMCLLAMVPLIWALYWTGSRGAEVALLVVLFLFFVFEVRRWGAILAVGGTVLLGVTLFWSRLLQILHATGHGVFSERLLLWKAALLMIRDHPLLGTGLDSFNTLYRPTAPNSYALKALDGRPFPAIYNPNLSHPHDFMLDVWISTGLLGVVALFWLLGAFVTILVRAYRLYAPSTQHGKVLQRLLIGTAGGITASMVHGVVDNFYFVPDLALLFWFLLSMALVIQRIAQQEQIAPQYQRESGTLSDRALKVSSDL